VALLGRAVLAIWNGIAPEAEADFVAWHVREHIPERVGLPGFLRGRRYVASDAEPAYFNFYETASAAALTSPAYLARLDQPTPWTRRVVAHFRDTSRTVCDVVASLGIGEGGWVETIRLTARPGYDLSASLPDGVMPAVLQSPGIVAIHLLRGRAGDSKAATAESALRATADATADWILLIEAVASEALRDVRNGAGATAALEQCGVAAACQRGIYQLQFGLSKTGLIPAG
jgi:hypothetical protein